MSSDELRRLPPIQDVLGHPLVKPLIGEYGHDVVVGWARAALQSAREQILEPHDTTEARRSREDWVEGLASQVMTNSCRDKQVRLRRVINATGIVLHTGLGRAPLSASTRQALAELGGQCNVEVDLETTDRRYRGHQMESAFQWLTGCEDALIVNNNAAATLLTLQALCVSREVVISRGQLIEIGGSFRLPEIFSLSGAMLREVGTTNRTHLEDYSRAMTPQTAAVMHVHPSNYRVIGFSETPPIESLVPLARSRGCLAIDDIGSGALVDVTEFGFPAEPTFQASIAAGADVVLGSGDKLLGGPQCGIILGKREFVERIRQHPLARAVRVGKLTLAALQATLQAYLQRTATSEIPTLAMLAANIHQLRERADAIVREIGAVPSLRIEIADDTTEVGGGSLPGVELPTVIISLRSTNVSPDELSRQLRLGEHHVFARIRNDEVILDLRSVLPEDDSALIAAVRETAQRR